MLIYDAPRQQQKQHHRECSKTRASNSHLSPPEPLASSARHEYAASLEDIPHTIPGAASRQRYAK
jgi:hypothetical protein